MTQAKEYPNPLVKRHTWHANCKCKLIKTVDHEGYEVILSIPKNAGDLLKEKMEKKKP